MDGSSSRGVQHGRGQVLGDKDEKSSRDLEHEGSSPHESMFFVLSYLPLFELLSMAQVCTSLRDAIYINDILPWLQIIVDRPLSSRLTDDILVRIVSKSKGRLRVLALINCVKITDEGLLRVIAQNPDISKLHLPGCTSLSADAVLTAVKILTKNNHILESLKISGIYGIHKEHLITLNNLTSLNIHTQQKQGKTLYHEYKKSWHPNNRTTINCLIDVDICPKCDAVRMIFDCPNQVPCERKKHHREGIECRGCEFCITRCIECGICILGGIEEIEEAACTDTVCLECWLRLPKCNFCNKPYCNQHTDQQCRLSSSSGWVCASCHTNFTP